MASPLSRLFSKCNLNYTCNLNRTCVRYYRRYRVGPSNPAKEHTVENYLKAGHPKFTYDKAKSKARHPGEDITLKELLQVLNAVDPDLHKPIDIGLPSNTKLSRRENVDRRKLVEEIKANENLEKAARLRNLHVPMIEMRTEWLKTDDGLEQIKKIAQHYGVFRDLFDNAHFYNRVPITVHFPLDEENAAPVYTGNHVKPSEAAIEPEVTFESDSDSLWTLILTNLDGHLLDSTSEYLHWFIGNIRGNDLKSGEMICDYLQPFPAKGTGYHRFVFILYKQNGVIDYSTLKKSAPCFSLKERTFKTYDFYSQRQDILTPASLAFFQSDYDDSVTNVFHNLLKMREPHFEYDFPPPVLEQQASFPGKVPFNLYLDKYRDPKEVAQEILMKRFKNVHPFKPEEPRPKYPNAITIDGEVPSWLKTEKFKENMRIGKYRGLDIEIFKPERPKKPILGIQVTEDNKQVPYT